MIYIIPTKRGIGVELWGTHGDLNLFYEVISDFWNDEGLLGKEGFDNRDELISGFSYELRKAKDGRRLKRGKNHIFPYEEIEYLGMRISWVQFLFFISAIKYNMQFYETNKLHISTILQIDFWLEKAMNSYDELGATDLIPLIDRGLYGANEYIYQYMRSINLEYFLLGGGKRPFRKLSKILRRGVYLTPEYGAYRKQLEEDAKRLNCKASELEIDDNDIDYDSIKW